MKTLIVDQDSADCRQLQEILAVFGECRTADSGKEAIAAVSQALSSGEPFDLITIEIRLPDMDGTETLFEIRDMEEEWESGGALIMMVTPLSDRTVIADAFSAGCDDYVIKPFNNKAIIKRLKNSKLRDRLLVTGSAADEAKNPIDVIIYRLNSGKIYIPPLPELNVKLNEMAKKGLDFKEIANLLKQDLSITSKIISMSNSTYYGAVTKTKTVEQAISRLGLAVTKQYVDALCNRTFFAVPGARYTKVTEKLWKHSLYCAVISEVVAKFLKLDLKGDAFTMGLLHDIGKMVLLQLGAELEARGKFGSEIDQAKLLESIDTYHNSLGAKVLKNWKFDDVYAQIAACHDDLGKQHPVSKELQVVHFANLLAKQMANEPVDQTGFGIEDAESAVLLGITPEMMEKIKEQTDRQMTVYG